MGPVGDYGWTYEHDQGRLAVEEHFGESKTVYIRIGSEVQTQRVMTQMALREQI